MPRENLEVPFKPEQFVFYGILYFRIASARKIRVAVRTEKQRIAREKFAVYNKTARPFRMPRSGNDFDFYSADLRFSFLQSFVGMVKRSGQTEFLSQIIVRVKHCFVPFGNVNLNAVIFRKITAHSVVEMPVRQKRAADV